MNGELRIGPDRWDEAIADVDGPQLVVAGPGTGKTEFLVRRVIHLLDRGTDPRTLLVLTFSRRGAADIRRRVAEGSIRSLGPLSVSTFHSFAMRVLETYGTHKNEGREMATLLTGPEQVGLVAELLASTDPTPWPVTHRAMFKTRTFAADLADFFLRMAERRIDADGLRAMVERRPDWRALPEFHERYTALLEERNRVDYGSLLDRAVRLALNPQVSTALGSQYNYVLVDEYQDTSPAQAELLEAVTSSHRNLTVAGDPHQSIYGFRGADVGNIARFADSFTDLTGEPARRIVLDQSFRVPAEILQAAERVSARGTLPGEAGRIRPAEHSGSVEVHVFDQASAEAEWVSSEIERLHLSEQVPYRGIAVLVRSTRNLLPELSRALDRRKIPHDTPDSRLVDHPGVRLVLDIAHAAIGAASTEPGVANLVEAPIRRILLSPLFDLGIAAERALRRERLRTGATWAEVLATNADTQDLSEVLSDSTWALESSASDGFWHVWDHLPRLTRFALGDTRAGYRAAWTAFAQVLDQQKDRDPKVSLVEYQQMAENDDFEATPLLSHQPSSRHSITLTTLHQAKGLEFDVVFIADATEDVFPDLRRGFNPLDPQALAGPTDRSGWLLDRLREETRLAYTSMTRASSRLVMTATTAGIDENERRPSRFLLAAANVATVDDLMPASPNRDDPLTPSGLQTVLRRKLMDPESPLAHRLAAGYTLAHASGEFWDAHRFAGVREHGSDRGVLSRPPRLSPTQAESYLECPRRYVFERRLAMSDTSGDHARFGTLVHNALEQADARAMRHGRPRPGIEDALEALDVVWQDEADFDSPWLDAIWRARAEEILTTLFAKWPSDSAATVAAERHLNWNGGGVEWVGRADRIERVTDGSLRVVDYKTSTRIPSKPEAEVSLQLAFYALAAMADPELTDPIGSAELWYPAADRVDMRRALNFDRLPELEATLIEIAKSISEENWDATPGPACERCSVRLVCPEWPEGREAFTS